MTYSLEEKSTLPSAPVENDYARFLEAAGFKVWKHDQVFWFCYNGFLKPAYLPHCTPAIDADSARVVLKRSGCLFARWDSDFDLPKDSSWWHIMRSGPYDISQVSGNTRSKIRRGMKRLEARSVSVAEMRQQGMAVCRKAVERYQRDNFLPAEQAFARKLDAAELHPASVEYFGVFDDRTLVGFSENHLQDNAVFWENIWYDADYLGDYSSYVLTHAMLDHYLNQRGMRYASDGSRSLYHDTNVQQFFVEKFGFERRLSKLNVVYKPMLKPVVAVLFGLRPFIAKLKARFRRDSIERVHGLLLQEEIVRQCKQS